MQQPKEPFKLHPQLIADCNIIGDFQLSKLLLMNNSHYPWFILVPKRADISEIYQLTIGEQYQLTRESAFLAAQLMTAFTADKINIAALGNQVPQLHLHHIVRYKTDNAWPNPVWGNEQPLAYQPNELQLIQTKLDFLLTGELEYTASTV